MKLDYDIIMEHLKNLHEPVYIDRGHKLHLLRVLIQIAKSKQEGQINDNNRNVK